MIGWVDLRREWPGLRGDQVHVLDGSLEADLRRALVRRGFSVLSLNGGAVRDERSFFEEASRSLGFPPHFGGNWDAFIDSLGDLGGGGPRRLALLWTDADRSLGADLQTFLTAVGVLRDAALDLGSGERSAPVQLEFFLLGSAPAFAVRPHLGDS
jgi:hypothetical protein